MVDDVGLPRAAGDSSRQVALYGEPWSARLTRLLQSYRISQAKLGAVIGLSAPMVSQLMSGRRVKISNPAVFGRIVRLEEQSTAPGVRAGDPAAIVAVLDEVTASHPTLTTLSTPVSAAGSLADLATPEQLRQVAAMARSLGAPRLAEVLEASAAR